MQQTQFSSRRAWKRRLMSLALAVVMILGLVPGFPGADSEASAHWADPYLSQLVEWGFIRADQAENPNRALTRADFMAIVNRAYGYETPGEIPFEDVKDSDWFYDDVSIAYNARYIKGTSPTTASPNSPLTRETSATILGRNMMLQESAGEILDFTDARRISTWAKGTIKSSLEHYLVSGYDDGTFRPQRNVSWGEMAAMISKIVGTPLQEPGDYSLGGTFGNVTITSPNVTLRDTVISGDLYITGGVGLGGVKLENVTVLGRIIASGTGRSEGGDASILLRNVTADEMLIDNLQDNYVSVKADGITEIGRTTVRTSAYIEDNTPDGMGLKYISLEGDTYPEGEEPEDWEPPTLDLAGRIEEVVNRTPGSQVHVGKGTVAKLTVDEAAVDSTVVIDRGAVVKELNLDTATIVTGEGDIEHLIVNAPGCEVEMLPDKIDIRPGITAIINGEEMDTVAAEESSMEPLILAGYPEARDITPTSVEAAFMTNKSGTVYWAVSLVTDGSVGEDELIKPPSYGSIAVKHGSVKSPKGNEEFSTVISGLTPGTDYYLSAILVDARDHRSPVKVVSFSTPDNTVPAFCAGYPHMSSTSPKNAIAVAMPTKDCKLYYALMVPNAVAPTADELKANAVAGALGYGVLDVYKNQESTFPINDVELQEKTTYVVYFLLSDGVNDSKVVSLTFTTKDETPPEFVMGPEVTDVKATSVGLTFQINEDGIVYWVAVPAGTLYPKPQPGVDEDTAALDGDYAKLQIMNGMNLGSEGKAGRVNAKELTDGKINVSGLKPEKAYDLYYLAVDTAGNRGLTAYKMTINTLDTSGPKFTQSFSHVAGTDKTKDPMSDTAIYLDVSENIRYDGEGGGKSILEIYQDVVNASNTTERNTAINRLANCLYNSIKLHKVNAQDNSEEGIILKHDLSDTRTDWVVDYTQVKVTSLSNGGIRIEFPSEGLHLENGGRYYFTIEKIRDVSNSQNEIVPEMVDFFRNQAASLAGGHNVPVFEVGMPRVDFSNPGVEDGPVATASDDLSPDLTFRMTPISTETVSDNISYDVIIWTATQLEFDLYYRVVDEQGKKISDASGNYPDPYNYTALNDQTDTAQLKKSDYLTTHLGTRHGSDSPDANGWFKLGSSGDMNPTSGRESGRSVMKNFNGCTATTFPKLKNLSSKLRYEFAIHITRIGDIEEQGTQNTWRNWNENVVFHVNVAAGQSNNLNAIPSDGTTDNPGGVTETRWKEALAKKLNGGALDIGRWYDANNQEKTAIELSYRFTDSKLPSFGDVKFPEINPDSVKVEFRMGTAGTLYWMVGEADSGSNKTAEITTTRKLMQGEVAADNNLLQFGSDDAYHIRLTDGPTTSTAPDGDGSLAPPDPTKGEKMQPWMCGTEENYPDNDNPEKTNLIVSPNKNWVMRPGSSSTTASALHGSKNAEGRKTENFMIEGLTPEKNYYLYIVVKGESDTLSHVYLYQFSTPKAAKPIIDLSRYNDGDKAGATIGTHIDSRLSYIVLTLSDAQNNIDILKATFSKDGTYIKNQNTTITTATTDAYSSMTVLDAMMERDNSGYTIFDMYATPELKHEMSNFLRNRFSTAYLTNGADIVEYSRSEMSLKGYEANGQSAKKEQELKNLYDGTDFVILAVAHVPNPNSTLEEEVDSYAAYAPLRKGLATPPTVTWWNAFLNMEGETATSAPYPGNVTVRFDKPLYFKDSTGKLVQLTSANADELLTLGTWTPTGNQTDSLPNRIKPTVKVDGQQTTITFENNGVNGGWKHGDTITIPGSQLYNFNGIQCDDDLLIEVRSATNPAGIDIILTYDSYKKSPETFHNPFIVVADDIRVELAVQNLSIVGTVTGPEMGTQTLEVKDGVKEFDVKALLSPTKYQDDAQFTWSSLNTGVVNVVSSTRKNETAKFEVKGVGEAVIQVVVTVDLGDGNVKTLEPKQMRVIVGSKLELTRATAGTGSEAKVTSNESADWVLVSATNPSLTLIFKSSRSLVKDSISVVDIDPKNAITTPTITVRDAGDVTEPNNNQALELRFSLNQAPKNNIIKFTINTGAGTFPITINMTDSRSQSGLVISKR